MLSDRNAMKSLIPVDRASRRIYLIRGRKIMLDRDLAAMYGVSTSRLNEQIKRNRRRFPEDFAFRLTEAETADWVSQNATANSWARMGLRIAPYVFTEHGAVAAAFVLNSSVAVAASIHVVRAFVRLKEMVSTHKELAHKLSELERKVESHDGHIRSLFDAIRQLMEPPEKPRRRIGFVTEKLNQLKSP